jgi:hypothetical protein
MRGLGVLAPAFGLRASGSCSSSGNRRERGGLLLGDELLAPNAIEVPPRTRFSRFVFILGRYKNAENAENMHGLLLFFYKSVGSSSAFSVFSAVKT